MPNLYSVDTIADIFHIHVFLFNFPPLFFFPFLGFLTLCILMEVRKRKITPICGRMCVVVGGGVLFVWVWLCHVHMNELQTCVWFFYITTGCRRGGYSVELFFRSWALSNRERSSKWSSLPRCSGQFHASNFLGTGWGWPFSFWTWLCTSEQSKVHVDEGVWWGSPDLNPVEHLWDALERKLRPSHPKSMSDLKNGPEFPQAHSWILRKEFPRELVGQHLMKPCWLGLGCHSSSYAPEWENTCGNVDRALCAVFSLSGLPVEWNYVQLRTCKTLQGHFFPHATLSCFLGLQLFLVKNTDGTLELMCSGLNGPWTLSPLAKPLPPLSEGGKKSHLLSLLCKLFSLFVAKGLNDSHATLAKVSSAESEGLSQHAS